jgi:uncharacterized membrane-anchored protein YjiN (DUF445 family)
VANADVTTDVRPEPSAPPPLASEAERRRQLASMKRRATGVLAAMTVFFIVVTLAGDDSGWLGYLQALAEGSMVGGIADWFAVTALFRHPLGIPIPHTAVIVERKDQFGRTLGEFVQENFLSTAVIGERIRSARPAERTGDWLADPANATRLAGHAAEVAVNLADVLHDEDAQRLIDQELQRALDALPLAPLAGRALRTFTDEGRHQELLDAALRTLEQWLERNRGSLHDRFGSETPWWLPGAVDDRIFDRLYQGVCDVLQNINDDPNHEFRGQFDAWMADLADQLEHSPEMSARADQFKRDLLANPELRKWTGSLWEELKGALRTQAADPASRLRTGLADAIAGLGHRLQDDPVLARKLDEMVETLAGYLTSHFQDEIADLVSGTISRWDANETSDRLELLLGHDLQWIRINGSVVGGIAGVLIHALGEMV